MRIVNGESALSTGYTYHSDKMKNEIRIKLKENGVIAVGNAIDNGAGMVPHLVATFRYETFLEKENDFKSIEYFQNEFGE